MPTRADKISLTGSISLGTGVMIGAGIFALVGQVAEFAGDWFPLAFLLGALVAGVSSYSYVRYSSVNSDRHRRCIGGGSDHHRTGRRRTRAHARGVSER